MPDPQKLVLEFHQKFGCPIRNYPTTVDPQELLLRSSLISEEAAEFIRAAANRDVVEMADAMADLLYVVYGTAIVLGVDLEPVFAEVHRSNMSKDGGGKTAGGKVKKGPAYTPPDIKAVLSKQYFCVGR